MHPSISRLIELVAGDLAGESRQEVEDHLRSCEPCRESRARVQRLVQALTADRLLEPSPQADRAVLRAFDERQRTAQIPRWAEKLERKVAELVFDTFARPDVAFAGARSATTARRLRFEAESMELDVLLETDGDDRHLTAQLLAQGAEPRPIAQASYFVSAGGSLAFTGETDDFGELDSKIREPGEIEICVAVRKGLAVFRIPDRADDLTSH